MKQPGSAQDEALLAQFVATFRLLDDTVLLPDLNGSSQNSVKTGVDLGNTQSFAENSGFWEAPCSAERG